MRAPVILIALALAGPAAAQAVDPGLAAQQNQQWMQQDALRQQTLSLERQTFVSEQKAQTDQALTGLAAQRAAQPLRPPRTPSHLDADLAAQADAIGRSELQPPPKPTPVPTP